MDKALRQYIEQLNEKDMEKNTKMERA